MSISRINQSGITITSSAPKLKSLTATSGLTSSPLNVTTSTISPTQVNLSWSAPTIGTPSSYVVVVSPSAGSISYSGTTANVTGLSPSTEYSFFVRGVNSNGSGSSANTPPVVTPAGIPGAVSGISASAVSPNQINLSWSAPTTGIAPTSYTVTVSPSAGSISYSGTTANVTGLAAGTTYTFAVFGTNSYGSGPSVNSSPTATQAWNNATGGSTSNVSNYNGTGQTWRVHSFSSGGTFTTTSATQPFRTLVTAGSGGGGASTHSGICGGPGGRGQTVTNDSTSLGVGSYTITVGGGGGGGAWQANPGGSGGSSSISGIASATPGSGGCGGCWGGGPATSFSTVSSNITGSSVTYGPAFGGGGCGDGAGGGPGSAGIVIISYRIA